MQSNPVDGTGKRIVRSRKLVVLPCGSLGTPPILERSGVGSPEILKQAGAPLVANWPGVGRGYQDHNLSLYVYKANLLRRLPPMVFIPASPDLGIQETARGRPEDNDPRRRGVLPAPHFPTWIQGALCSRDGRGRDAAGTECLKSLEYAPEDDAAIEDWIRHNIATCWHGIGTCNMAQKEQLGVVDENLGAHDEHGLKVADLSSVPESVCANTMNTALVIGEKAAHIFIQELGLGWTSHVTESQVNSLPDIGNNQVDAVHSPREVSSDTGLGRIKIPFIPVPGVIGSLPYWQDDVRGETHHEHLLNEEENNIREEIETEIQPIKPDTVISRVCSTSSSYPSEGIRSPSPGPNSPQPTASTEAFIADIVQYGSLHLSASPPQSDPSSYDWSSPDLEVGLGLAEELAAVSGISDNTGSRLANSEYGIDNVPLRETPGQPSKEPAQPKDMLTYSPNGNLGKSPKDAKGFLEHACVQHVASGPDTVSPPPASTVNHPVVEASRHSENSNEALQSNSPLARNSIRSRDTEEATTSAMAHTRSQDTANTIDASQSFHSLHRVPNVNQASKAGNPLLARTPSPNPDAPSPTHSQGTHQFRLKLKKRIKKVISGTDRKQKRKREDRGRRKLERQLDIQMQEPTTGLLTEKQTTTHLAKEQRPWPI
ncbi:hypothetical protein DL767_008699 [Monosporascus sp. MG133]|nr:hypothetical protein DL767_008699 [Monosporascus sp. MG133]